MKLLSWIPRSCWDTVYCCFCSISQSCPTLCNTMYWACQASLSFTISHSLFRLLNIESVMPTNHPILCYPLLLLPSNFPSIRVFPNESLPHIRWRKYWSFSIHPVHRVHPVPPSKAHSGLISFRMDWSELLAVQGTLKSLQHHSSKPSILQCSAFFMVHLSHPYMIIVKIIALALWTFVSKWRLCFLSLS